MLHTLRGRKAEIPLAPRTAPMLAARLAALALLACGPAATQAADFDCVIEPREVIELRSPIEGLIERINVDRGDTVQKGQLVAQLDTSVERAAASLARHRSQMQGAVRAGESRVELTRRKYDRAEELQKRNFVTAQARDEAASDQRLASAELQDAQDNRKSAELELVRQNELIRLKTLRSPFDGVVVERLQNPGELAEAGVGRKPILKLAEIGTLYVEVILPVEAWGKVSPGMKIDVLPDIPGATAHAASVKVVDRVHDAASATFGVRLELPNPKLTLPAGVRCRASFPMLPQSGTPRAATAPADRSARK
ncbi:MAG: efflux RND transporter periplasmic adaptor subunit [Rhodocyclaceae bacterium]|nr:efflux RND transporter periplasmic adaptor subunit [Rhodocyclaceae bacterium]